jgi:LPXTG-motif cell wall-anchored protein
LHIEIGCLKTEGIPDEDTPLGPATGEAENLLSVVLAAVSATGLFVLTIARKKTVKE